MSKKGKMTGQAIGDISIKKGLTLSTLTEKIKKAVAGYLSASLQKSVFQHSLLPDLWTQILKTNMVEQATCLQSKVNLL